MRLFVDVSCDVRLRIRCCIHAKAHIRYFVVVGGHRAYDTCVTKIDKHSWCNTDWAFGTDMIRFGGT